MDFKKMEYFIAVAKNQSYTKAAEELFITPSALSKRIKELEDEIGVPLLKRNHHAVSFTPVGRQFYQDAVEILRLVNQAVCRAKNYEISAASLPRLRIGLSLTDLFFGRNLIEQRLAQYGNTHPEFTIEKVIVDFSEIENLLSCGAIDVCISDLSPQEKEKLKYHSAVLTQHKFCLLTGGSLAMTSEKECIEEVLVTRPLLMVKGDARWNDWMLNHLIKPLKLPYTVRYIEYSNAHFFSFVESGGCAVILPIRYIESMMAAFDISSLNIFPLSTTANYVTTDLIWARDDAPLVSELVSILRNFE